MAASASTSVSAAASATTTEQAPGAGADQLLLLGAAAQQAGEQQRALDLFLRAIAARPGDWIAHSCAATALKALGRLDEAIGLHLRAVELGGDHRALSNLALAYREAGRLDDGIAALRAAVARAPEAAEVHGNLAGLLLAADRPVEAEAAARAALALAPDEARFESNLGYARKEQGDFAGAVVHLRRAIARNPDDADAHWNLGLTLLTTSASPDEESEGWRELEWRQRIPGLRVAPSAATAAMPRWNGEPLAGRTLLLQAEQGLGDTLQLARYARAAKRLAGATGTIIVECQPPLARLLAGCAGVDRVVARGDDLPRAHARLGLFSGPGRLGGRAPAGEVGEGGGHDGGSGAEGGDRRVAAYLHAEPPRIARWRARLDELTGGGCRPRVGIAWQGNRRYRADGRRSIPFAFFRPVIDAVRALGGVVVSLQKGDGQSRLADLAHRGQIDACVGAQMIDLGALPDVDADGAFVDTAAVIAGLDLVVTSDTAIPHLAGALGAPVWMALAHLPDWRWGLTGESSLWYPGMRLFRQARAGDWGEVFARIARAVGEGLVTGA